MGKHHKKKKKQKHKTKKGGGASGAPKEDEGVAREEQEEEEEEEGGSSSDDASGDEKGMVYAPSDMTPGTHTLWGWVGVRCEDGLGWVSSLNPNPSHAAPIHHNHRRPAYTCMLCPTRTVSA